MQRNFIPLLVLFVGTLGDSQSLQAGSVLEPALRARADLYIGCEECSDTDPDFGRSPDRPFCSFERALYEVVDGEGALIHVMGGTYNEQVRIRKSGREDSPLVIEPFPGDSVILDGTGHMAVWDDILWHGLLGTYDVSHVILRGMTIENVLDHRYREPVQQGDPLGFGVQVSASNHVVLENLLVRNVDHGGIVFDGGSSDFEIVGNEVTRTNRIEEDRIAGAVHEAITVSCCQGFIIEKNNVHDVYEEGIDVKDDSREGRVRYNTVARTGAIGIYLNVASRIDVYRNVVQDAGNYRDPASDSGDGICLSAADGTCAGYQVNDNRIFRNRISNSSRQGISVHSRGATDYEIVGNRVFNNTIHGSGWTTSGGFSIYLAADGIADDNVIFNNIFSTGNGWIEEVHGNTAGFSGHHNVYYNTYASPETEIEDLDPWHPSESVLGSPSFVDPEEGDFTLGEESVAIDEGICLPGCIYHGEAVDAGAFEFVDDGNRHHCISRQEIFVD